jgi:hypothetical protein
MRTFFPSTNLVRDLRFVFAFCLLAIAALAQELSWIELARRPELWPTQCTLLTTIKFDGGASVPSGQSVKVVAVKPNEADFVTLDGKTNFAADPNETDLLKVAKEAFAKLTPRQRALTYATIAQQKDLWPASITLTKTIKFSSGATFREGEQLPVVEIRANRIVLRADAYKTTFDLAPQDTNLIVQARQFVEDAQAGPRFVAVQQQQTEQRRMADEKRQADEKLRAQTRVLAELDGKLLNSATGKADPLDPAAKPRYIVFYRGSSTCPITRQFTPTLIKYYQQMKQQHPEFEIVWMMTESPQDTAKFARELGFSWRAVTYETYVASVHETINGKLPQMMVVDLSGKVLVNGWQDTAPTALRQLDALLKQSARVPQTAAP